MTEIISVIDNCSSAPDYHAEHGLSIFIRHNGASYLLDAGASDKCIVNAQKMGLPLQSLDGVILSHNHFDHTGGLSSLLALNGDVPVYAKRAAKGKFYYKVGFLKKHIGAGRGLLRDHADRFTFFDGDLRLSDTVSLLSNTEFQGAYACRDTNLLEKKNGRFVPDTFHHELFVVIEERDGLVILSSCSHSGIVNIVDTARRKFPQTPITHIIGGFHFAAVGPGAKPSQMNCSEAYIQEVSRILRDACREVHTCHCTGKRAYGLMKETIPHIGYFDAGKTITIA